MAKRVVLPYDLKTAESLGVAFSTAAVSVRYTDNVGIFIKTASVTTNTGSFIVEGTIDGTNWFDFGLSPTLTLANANTTFAVNLNQVPFDQVRVSFTPSVTTPNGTALISIMAKSVGV